jgi:hypothetical protein
MSGVAHTVELRIWRLVVDQGALGGTSRAEFGERVQAAIGRRLAGAPAEPHEGLIGEVAGRVAAAIATARPGGER